MIRSFWVVYLTLFFVSNSHAADLYYCGPAGLDVSNTIIVAGDLVVDVTDSGEGWSESTAIKANTGKEVCESPVTCEERTVGKYYKYSNDGLERLSGIIKTSDFECGEDKVCYIGLTSYQRIDGDLSYVSTKYLYFQTNSKRDRLKAIGNSLYASPLRNHPDIVTELEKNVVYTLTVSSSLKHGSQGVRAKLCEKGKSCRKLDPWGVFSTTCVNAN